MFGSTISTPTNVTGISSHLNLIPVGTAAATSAAACGNAGLTELRKRVLTISPPPSPPQTLLAQPPPPRTPVGIDLASLRNSVAIQSTINLTAAANLPNPPSQAKWGVNNFACAESAIVPCPRDIGKEIDEVVREFITSNNCTSNISTGIGAASVLYAFGSVWCDPGLTSAIGSGLVETVKQVQQYFNLNVTYNTKAENLKTFNRLCTTLREKYCQLAIEFLDQYVGQKQLTVASEADQKHSCESIAEAQTISLNWSKITAKLREKLQLRDGDALRKEISSDPTNSIAHPLKIAADIITCDSTGKIFDPKDSTTAKRLLDHFSDKLQKKQDRHEIAMLRKAVDSLTGPVKPTQGYVSIDITALQKEVKAVKDMIGKVKELVLVKRLDKAEELKNIKIDIAALEAKQRKLEKALQK